jgi:ribonuclease E
VHGPSARPARSPRPHRERPRAAAETSSQEDNQIPENANAGPGSGTNATGSETVEPTVRTARASRGRRGGRRRNERPTPDAEQDGAPQGLDSEAVTAPTGTSGTDGPEASDGPADNGTDMPRKRRRRGRRGGRRHRGSRGSEAGTLGAPEDSSGPDPGPASAAAGRADAPEENER